MKYVLLYLLYAMFFFSSDRCDVMLVIKSATGGIWKFPVRFIASEPTPDDTITLEAAGLNKTSSVGIRLTSQTK